MKDLTVDQLQTAAANHDAVINEGGDGYNPYRDEIARRDSETTTPPSLQEQLNRVTNQLNAIPSRVMQHKSGSPQEIAELDALTATQDNLKTAIAKAFADEWTPDETQRRRNEWNARVKAGEFNTTAGQIDYKLADQAQRDQGWSFSDLKKAVAMHKGDN